MGILTTAQAAERLDVSVRRVQQLVKAGRLPAKVFGGSLMIQKSDLKLVADRKLGRPRKSATGKAEKMGKKRNTR
jgi:excisionase family DNA binding protein